MDAEQIRGLKSMLARYLKRFDGCFARRDTRAHLSAYVEGQLSDQDGKSVEPIAVHAGIPPRTPQMFLARYKWDEDRLRDWLRRMVIQEHTGKNSVGIIDVKKGQKHRASSVSGAARSAKRKIAWRPYIWVTPREIFTVLSMASCFFQKVGLTIACVAAKRASRGRGKLQGQCRVGPVEILARPARSAPDEIKYFVSNAPPAIAQHWRTTMRPL